MSHKISRREFLKLAAASGLGLSLPRGNWQVEKTTATNHRQNFLIIVLDALSAYHLSTYGYSRETMPNLNRLADQAIVYHQNYSGGNYTTPGTASILTGTLPWTHRAITKLTDTVADEFITKNIFHAFPDYYRMAYSHNTLVTTQLNQFKHDIDAYIPRSKLFIVNNHVLDQIFPADEDIASIAWVRSLNSIKDDYSYSLFFSRFLETYIKGRTGELKDQYPRGLPNINLDDYFVLDQGIDYICQLIKQAPQPFLGYFHFLPPHEPYNPSKEFIGRFQKDGYQILEKSRTVFSRGKSLKQLNKQNTEYDEFILYADQGFARLYQFLEQAGILETTWVILTSDHGELFERGLVGHLTPMLYQPVIRVPLFIFEPKRTSRMDIYQNTSGTDIFPTMLALSGQEIPAWIEGQVLPPFNQSNLEDMRPIYALQAKGTGKKDPIVRATVMLVEDHYKMIYYFGYRELRDTGPFIELYDVQNDPHEMHNLYLEHKTQADEMLERIKAKLADIDKDRR